MKKYIITISILFIFIFILFSGRFLKNISFDNGTFPSQIDNLISNIEASNWDNAQETFTLLNNDWNKIIKLIQFSCERSEIHALSISLSRVEISINNKDKLSALLELSTAKEYWLFLGN